MRLDQNPIYRKVIYPWYESEMACLIVIILMFIVFLFGFIGISVARETTEYHSFVWVPILVVALSGVVILSTTIRLIRRYANLKHKSK